MPMWTSSQEPTTTHVLLLMRTTTAQLASALLVVQLANGGAKIANQSMRVTLRHWVQHETPDITDWLVDHS